MIVAQAGGAHGEGGLDWYRNATFVSRFPDLEARFAARFDALGTLYVSPGTAAQLSRYDRDGAYAGFVYAPGGFAGTIVIDAAGNFYTPQFAERRIAKISPNGDILRTYDFSSLPRFAADTADLASDQCTLFFTIPSQPMVGRYDVCSDVRLPDLTTTLPTLPREIRLLADGTLLVAAGPNIHRLNSGGQIVQSYFAGAGQVFSALAIDASGLTFWASAGSGLIQFRLADSALLRQLTVQQTVTSIAIFGEPREATGSAPIPTIHFTILMALATALAAIGSLAILRH